MPDKFKKMRSICLIFFLILTLNTAMAVKAPPYPVQVRQPDGSIITLYIRGDELYRYCQKKGLQIDILINNAGIFAPPRRTPLRKPQR